MKISKPHLFIGVRDASSKVSAMEVFTTNIAKFMPGMIFFLIGPNTIKLQHDLVSMSFTRE